jgi:Flp pilus assembly protein TadG
VLPIFCALLFGIIDYAWYFYQRFSLATAVRDGVRVAATVNPNAASPNDYTTLAVARATADLSASGMSAPPGTFTATTGLTSGSAPLKTVTLSGTVPFKPLVNFVKLPKSSMTYSMTMMFEQQN